MRRAFEDVSYGLDLRKDGGQLWPDAVKAVDELDDWRLTRAWRRFTKTAPDLRGFLCYDSPRGITRA